MAVNSKDDQDVSRKKRLVDAIKVLSDLKFAPKQRNEVAGYTLLALLDLTPDKPWSQAERPLCGITPIIKFIAENYGVQYAPNTRETIRDEAVKFFVGAGLLLLNPDKPDRAINSGRTVYQVEPTALALLHTFGTSRWPRQLKAYLDSVEEVRKESNRQRKAVRVPVTLPSGRKITLSPGGQNPLIKLIIEEFCPRFVSGGIVLYVGDAESKFVHLEFEYLAKLGIRLDGASKIPDVVIHDVKRNWLLLIEAVTSAGPVDGKRRKELKALFSGSKAGLVFVTAFNTRSDMRSFLSQIAWESEVWIADDPEHMIHFNGDKFLGPYADTAFPLH